MSFDGQQLLSDTGKGITSMYKLHPLMKIVYIVIIFLALGVVARLFGFNVGMLDQVKVNKPTPTTVAVHTTSVVVTATPQVVVLTSTPIVLTATSVPVATGNGQQSSVSFEVNWLETVCDNNGGLTTWPDGSQGCGDGTSIGQPYSDAGYCMPVVTQGDGWRLVKCHDTSRWIGDRLIEAQPTAVADNRPQGQYNLRKNEDGTWCVTALKPDGQAHTVCGLLSEGDAVATARFIELGQITSDKAPKG